MAIFHLSIIPHSLSPSNIYESRPRNINNISTSDESMKIMIWSKMAQKWSKWPKKSLHQSSFRLDMRYRKFEGFLETSSFSQWFGMESPV